MKTPTLESFFEVGGIRFKITSIEDKTVEVVHNDYENSVVIPSLVDYNGTTYSVTSIGDEAFKWCRGLESIVIPNSVTAIGEWAFKMCYGLESIVISNSVTEIGESAFYYCERLKSIVIPDSVTSIGEYAFQGCRGLESIVIPNSVTTIGSWAFSRCSGLNSIISHIPADKLFPIEWTEFEGIDKSNCTLSVPKGAKEVYAKTDGWSNFENIVELKE